MSSKKKPKAVITPIDGQSPCHEAHDAIVSGWLGLQISGSVHHIGNARKFVVDILLTLVLLALVSQHGLV